MHETPPITTPGRAEPGPPTADRINPPAGPERGPVRDGPVIWVGSWLNYTDGQLYGDWVNADQADDEIAGDIAAVLSRAPLGKRTGRAAEDWGIFDSDGFGPLILGESEPLPWIGAVGRGIAEHGAAFAGYADLVQDTAALSEFANDYLGDWPSLEAYADSFVEDAGYNQLLDGALPDSIRGYVRLDTAAIARDMWASGAVHQVANEEGVWLFAAR